MEQARFEEEVKIKKRKEQESSPTLVNPCRETRNHWLRRLLKEQGAAHTSEDLRDKP